jgi:GT2 family glycosyltransferase
MSTTDGRLTKISVIIPNLNCPILDQALDALYAQSIEPDVSMEVIVIGQDEPGRLRDFPQVTYIPTEHPVGPATARNIGIRFSCGELIACMDADCIPDPSWLSEMIAAHGKHPDRAVIGGSIKIDADNYWAQADNLSSFHAYLPTHPAAVYPVLPTCNVSTRREAFEQVGLFDEALLFDEDADWMMRARQKGFTLYFYPSAVVWHRTQRHTCKAVLSHAQLWGNYSIVTRLRYSDMQPLPAALRAWWSLALLSPLIALAVTFRIYARNPGTWRYLYTLPVILLAKLAWCRGAVSRLKQGSRD